MPALLTLVAALVINVLRHKTGRSTICSTTRKRVRPRLFCLGWAALSAWLIPHYCRPFRSPAG